MSDSVSPADPAADLASSQAGQLASSPAPAAPVPGKAEPVAAPLPRILSGTQPIVMPVVKPIELHHGAKARLAAAYHALRAEIIAADHRVCDDFSRDPLALAAWVMAHL